LSSHKRILFATRLVTVILTLAASWPFTKPLIVASLVSRADLYLVNGKTATALAYVKRASLFDENNPELLTSRSLAYVGAPVRVLGPVRDDLRERANAEPDNGELWRDLAIMDTRRKDYSDARYEIHMATRTMHDDTTETLQRVLDARR
jgi:hypothetical protein